MFYYIEAEAAYIFYDASYLFVFQSPVEKSSPLIFHFIPVSPLTVLNYLLTIPPFAFEISTCRQQ